MKIYISADMEGLSGVVSQKQVINGNKDYERARSRMTKEVNAVIDALFAEGANEVVVNDSHAGMDNILIEEFDGRATLISGSPKPYSMMEGIDPTYDAVFFVGYHGKPGTVNSVMDHTYSSSTVFEARINGTPLGEAGINGRLAGYYGVPVAFLTGDQNAVMCAEKELHDLTGVVVKEAIGRTSARLFPFPKVVERINNGVKQAVEKIERLKPTIEEGEIKLEVDFNKSSMAEMAMLMPGTERKSGRTVAYSSDDFKEVFRAFRAMISLAGSL